MAIILVGGNIAEIRGSEGGTTYSRNRFGAYSRSRVKPVNPNTSGQVAARSRFNYLAAYWKDTLTAAQRAGWELYASNTAWKNRLGQDVYLTGLNHFCRSNSLVLQVGGTLVVTPPTTFGLPDQEDDWTLAATADDQKVTVTYSFDANVDDQYFAFWQGKPVSASRNFFAGPWRYLGVVAGDAATPPSSPAEFDAVFPVGAGQNCNVYCRRLDADGRVTQPFRVLAVVAAS